VTLPLFAAERQRPLHGARNTPTAIDRYLIPAANPPHVAAADHRRDRQTDGHLTVLRRSRVLREPRNYEQLVLIDRKLDVMSRLPLVNGWQFFGIP